MHLIVGLGNIGSRYNLTRHNIGFEVIDYLSDKYNIKINRTKFDGDYGRGYIGDEEVFLLKPRTFMNLSGKCVVPFMHYFKIETKDLYVVYDDVEIPKGALRIRKAGSAGTHNGMKSIIENLGENTFPRFRLGIARDAEEEKIELHNYVLGKFSDKEIPVMQDLVIKTSNAIDASLNEGIDKAMNKYNG